MTGYYRVVFRIREQKDIYIHPSLMEQIILNSERGNQTSFTDGITFGYDEEIDEFIALNMRDVLHISLIKDSETANYEV